MLYCKIHSDTRHIKSVSILLNLLYTKKKYEFMEACFQFLCVNSIEIANQK